jgi:hypothetical protein
VCEDEPIVRGIISGGGLVEPCSACGSPTLTSVDATSEPPGSSRPPSTTVHWRVSGHDLKRHAFPEIGETFSEALCEHCCPSDRLVDIPADTCLPCQLIHGDLLADRRRDIIAGQIRQLRDDNLVVLLVQLEPLRADAIKQIEDGQPLTHDLRRDLRETLTEIIELL